MRSSSASAGVPKENQAEEGINLAVEQIEELKGVPGIRGFHIMAIEWEEKVPEIVQAGRPLSPAAVGGARGTFFPGKIYPALKRLVIYQLRVHN